MDFRPEYLAKSSKRGSGYLSSQSLHVIQGKGIEKYAVEACSLKSYAPLRKHPGTLASRCLCLHRGFEHLCSVLLALQSAYESPGPAQYSM